MSNPWPHRARRFDPERGQYVAVTGDSVADDVAVTWSAALAEAGHSLDEIDACAARVRDGARAACKRLRAKVAALEDWLDFSDNAWNAASEKLDAALAERDAARLELRALEWLTLGDHFGDVLWMRAGKPWTSAGAWKDGGFRVEEIEHPTYADAARALGWEG